jgi:hypothetical protein
MDNKLLETLQSVELAKIVTAIYVCLGPLLYSVTGDVPQWYIAILLFISFKVVFKYEKCTVSYIECKARGVKKEEGYIYNFLNSFHKLRDNKFLYFCLILYVALISIVYFCVLGKRMII